MPTFTELGITVRVGGPVAQKTECPVCAHEHKKKDKCLSINTANGFFNCHRCHWKGKAGEKTESIEKREYKRPRATQLPISERMINWFEGRGITRQTLQYFKVSESVENMPPVDSGEKVKRTCVNFNYYRGNELINIKYRDALKNFKMAYEAELILYNLNALDGATDALICEGEPDCMIYYQSGHYRAVSVPNGASRGSAKLEYLDNCWSAFEKLEKIIIATDGDEAGDFLRDELVRRLGAHRCWLITYPEGCKDANEVWLKYGEQAVRDMWKNARPPRIEYVVTPSDMRGELDDIYLNGWPVREPVGHEGFDEMLNFEAGQITMVTGLPGHGKDEFLMDLMCRKAARYGENIGVFNREEPAKIIAIKICQKFIGRPYYRAEQNEKMNLAQRDAGLKFLEDHFSFVDVKMKNPTVDAVINKAIELVLRKNIKYFVAGPWNCFEHSRGKNQSEGDYIGECLQKFKWLASEYGIHVFLVAHPVKIFKDKDTKKFPVPTLYQISGSANFFNMTDNGLTVYRNYDDNTTDIHVQKVKFFYNGRLDMQSFNFDVSAGRYAEMGKNFESQLSYRQNKDEQVEIPEEVQPEDVKPGVFRQLPANAAISFAEPAHKQFSEPADDQSVPF